MKMYEDTNVHCLYSFHDKVWTNEMESKMWNWTWTFYFVSNNRMQIMKSKCNAFSGIVVLFYLFQFWKNYSYKLCFVTYSSLLFLKMNITADQILRFLSILILVAMIFNEFCITIVSNALKFMLYIN